MKSIYCLDDDGFMLKLLKDALSAWGYEVKTFDSANDFFNTLMENPPDAIILDFFMPGLDGEKTIKMIEKFGSYSKIPIILYSGAKKGKLEEIKEKHKIAGFIEKKVRINAFVVAMEKILGWDTDNEDRVTDEM